MRLLLLLAAAIAPLLSFSQNNETQAKIDSLNQAAETAVSDTARARTLCRLCKELRVAGQTVPALETGEAGLQLARRAGDPRAEGECLKNIGVVFAAKGDIGKALDYSRQSLQAFEAAGDADGRKLALNNIGIFHEITGDFNAALESYQKSLAIKGARSHDAKTLNNMGVVYARRGDYARALEAHQKSLTLHKAAGDKGGMAEALNNIGINRRARGEHGRALEVFREALGLARERGDKNAAADALRNVGLGLKRLRDFSGALDAFQNSLRRYRETGNPYGQANVLDGLGNLHAILKNREASRKAYQESLALFEQVGDASGIATALANLADLSLAEGRAPEARRLAARAAETAEKVGALAQLRFAMQVRAQADSALGDFAAAYAHHKAFKQYSDSLVDADKAKTIGRLEAEFAFEQETAAREREEAAAAERRQMLAWIAAGAFAALGLIAGLLAWGLKTKRAANDRLSRQNAHMQQQSEEIRAQHDLISEKNDELDAALAKLRELSEFKEEMTGMLVHDLKNPLSVVLSFAELPGPGRAPLRAAALQMHDLAMNMLDVQQFESASVRLQLKPAAAARILREAREQAEYLLAEKQIELRVVAPESLLLLADETYLARMLANLLGNAIKFTPAGGHILLEARANDELAELVVADSGPGLPEDKLESVFDKYAKLEDRGANRGGTGLGLTFCKLAAEAHGGTIRAENAPEGGAVFRLTLPLAEPFAAGDALAAEAPQAAVYSNEPALTKTDRAALAPVAARIRRYEIYELSEISRELEQLAERETPGVARWRDHLEYALFALDEKAFEAGLREAEA